MKFRTEIPLTAASNPIRHENPIFLAGSCFAVHMAQQLEYHGFAQQSNPFGIIFQPQALAKTLEWAVTGKVFTASDVFQHESRWHCFDAHSDLSHPDQQILLANLNQAVAQTRTAIANSTHVVLTFGTAWVYEHKETGQTVANCHKVPQMAFEKRLLKVSEVREAVTDAMLHIRSLNATAAIITTLSPVRHLKDGFVGNQRSKAHLIAGLHDALADVENAGYFPAYELLMDDLRDYRFYAQDLMHPSAIAVQYIWERFGEMYTTNATQKLMAQVVRLRKAFAHRPFDGTAAAHQKFLEGIRTEAQQLAAVYPQLSF